MNLKELCVDIAIDCHDRFVGKYKGKRISISQLSTKAFDLDITNDKHMVIATAFGDFKSIDAALEFSVKAIDIYESMC